MAQFIFLFLLLANAFLGLAMDTKKPQTTVQSISAAPSLNPPAQSPCSGQRSYTSQPSDVRKLGKHQHMQVSPSGTPSPSPSEAPQSEKEQHSSAEGSTPSHQRTSVKPHDEVVLGSQTHVHLLNQHRHSFDKSIAGGGVILGGLATTFLVSVFCYIRATGRNKSETTV